MNSDFQSSVKYILKRTHQKSLRREGLKHSQAPPKNSKSWAPLHALTATQMKDASTPKGLLYKWMLPLSRASVSGCWWLHAPLSMGLSRQEHWSGLPIPSPVYMNRYEGKKRLGTRVKIYFYLALCSIKVLHFITSFRAQGETSVTLPWMTLKTLCSFGHKVLINKHKSE